MTPVTPELIEQVRVLRAAGLSLRAIASRAGIGYGTAHKLAPRLAPPPPVPEPRPMFHLHSPGPRSCCWPINSARPWQFCPEDRLPGRVYCLRHHRLGTVGRSWHAEAAE